MPVVEQPISNAYESLREQLRLPSPSIESRSTARENLQSRLRGNILMTISNAENRLLLSTGNKPSWRWATAPLRRHQRRARRYRRRAEDGSLRLAKHLNREREIIPSSIIDSEFRAAELVGQFDDQSLPPYDQLDRICVCILS